MRDRTHAGQNISQAEAVIRAEVFVRRFLCQGLAAIVAETRSSPGAALLAVKFLA